MPKISIVIPCYNSEEYLKECLQSVLSQTFSDFEIICIDDCSSDKTKAILQSYDDCRIHIISNSENKGLPISRNIGIQHSKGEYIFFLDSDDFLANDCLKQMYSNANQLNSDVVIGKTETINMCGDKGEKWEKRVCKWLQYKDFRTIKVSQESINEIYSTINCTAWNKLYKASLLKQNNILFINKRCAHEDHGFWIKILSCNPLISSINKITYHYRIRPSSIMTNAGRIRSKDLHESLTDALEYVKKQEKFTLIPFIKHEIRKLNYNFFNLTWNKNEKKISFFGITLFKLKNFLKEEKTVFKLLGFITFTVKQQRVEK